MFYSSRGINPRFQISFMTHRKFFMTIRSVGKSQSWVKMDFQLEISRYQNLVSKKNFDPKIKLSQFVSGMHPNIFRCSWSLQMHSALFSTLQHLSIWCKGQKSTFHLEILKSKVWSYFFLTKNKLIPICFKIVSLIDFTPSV